MFRSNVIKLISIIIFGTYWNIYSLYVSDLSQQLADRISSLTKSSALRTEAISISPEEVKFPLRDFVFVKTHKTGSTTVTNILFRYAETHGLNVLIDGNAAQYTEYGDLTKRTFTPAPPRSKHNAFMLHADYNPQFLRSKLGENTKFITILRDPVSKFISGFNYMGYHHRWYKSLSFYGALNTYLDELEAFNEWHADCMDSCEFANGIANDFGFDLGFQNIDFGIPKPLFVVP